MLLVFTAYKNLIIFGNEIYALTLVTYHETSIKWRCNHWKQTQYGVDTSANSFMSSHDRFSENKI